MRTVWTASAVFFVGAVACVVQNRAGTALLFAALGFALIQVAESNIDWQQRITRRDWRRQINEPKWQITVFGRLAQVLSFACLLGFFLVAAR